MNLHKNCDSLPIYNFYQIVEGNQFQYLVIGYNDLLDKIPVFNIEECKVFFQDILSQYGELTSNKEVILNITKQIEIQGLEFELLCIMETLTNFKEFEDVAVFKLLENFGINIDVKKNLENQINMIVKKVKSLRNKIKIRKSKYAQRFKKTEEDIKHNLDKEALMLEMNLDLGREINTRTTTVTRWIHLINASADKAKAYQKNKI